VTVQKANQMITSNRAKYDWERAEEEEHFSDDK
jgi:hypothetical protein